MSEDRNLARIAAELRFISRQVQTIEPVRGCDFETVDEIAMAVRSALDALEEYDLSLQPATTEEELDAFLVTTYSLEIVAPAAK